MSSQTNKSIMEGIKCLQEISKQEKPMGCRELARLMQLDPTRVNRLLMTFEEEGILLKNDKKKYMPGPGIYVLSAQCIQHSTLVNKIFKAIESLPSQNYTLAFGFLWQKNITYLFHGEPGAGLSIGMNKTKAYFALDSSIGQILLAQKEFKELEELFSKEELKKYGFNSKLIQQLRDQRYCSIIRKNRKPEIYSTATTIDGFPFAGLAITNIETSINEDEVVKKLFDLKESIQSSISNI